MRQGGMLSHFRIQTEPEVDDMEPESPQQPIAQAYKYCPLCSASLTINGKPVQCDECGYSMYFSPVAAVGGLVVNQHDELLFVRRAKDPGKGKWGLPGGFVDAGESCEEATVREVVEETQLRVTETNYLCSFPNEYTYQGLTSPVIDVFYLCKVETLDNVTVDQHELDGFEWSQPDQAHLDNMAFLSNRKAIERWIELQS